MCPPLGSEYLFSHPTFKLLARTLAESGHHVLRFDYYGSGDSAGNFEETDQEQWLRDIDTAIDELKDLGNLERVTLMVLRYGGYLALEKAKARKDVDRLVLWNPIVDGRQYLTEVCAPGVGANGNSDADGMVVTPRIRADIERATVDSFGTDLPATLILVTTTPSNQYEILRARLASAGSRATFQHVADVPAWRNSHLVASALPVTAVKTITEWLS
jgi:pimeloyl-ACP methyl ester carboxylesterase